MRLGKTKIIILYMLIFMVIWIKGYMPHIVVYISNLHVFTGVSRQNTAHRYERTVQNLTQKPIQMEPTEGEKHIIFIETSCLLDRSRHGDQFGLVLKKRQACAIESAAKANPNLAVYLLHSCPLRGSLEYSSDFVKPIFTYSNVKIWELNSSSHFLNTPLDKWNFRDALSSSFWPTEHSSDIFRYLTLWKYGGTYLDLDIMVLKPLSNLGRDYVGVESPTQIASSVLSFGSDGVGHLVADLCLQEIANNFRGDVWAHNGPGVITRVLKFLCRTHRVPDMPEAFCGGFHVYPESTLFPLALHNWDMLFKNATKEEIARLISSSFTIHLWNYITGSTQVIVGSRQLYSVLAETFCPRVYLEIGNDF